MTELKRPHISVVIPALNEELYLARTLRSLAAQSYGDFEVIVADNGSTDQTSRIARQAGAKVVYAAKRGVCAARQAGTEAARGQIIVSTDADTIFPSDWLERIAAAFTPGVVLVAGRPQFENAPLWGRVYPRALFGLVNVRYRFTKTLPYAPACNLAFLKSAWSGYNTDLTQGGDEFFILRQLKDRGRFVYLKDNVVLTSSRRLKKGLLYNIIVTLFGYYLGDYALSRVTNKSLLGSFPEVRDAASQKPSWGWRIATVAVTAASVFTVIYSRVPMAHALSKDIHRPHLHKIDLDWHLHPSER